MLSLGPASVRSQPTASPVNFFHLPIELRNDVYQRVLAVPLALHLFQDAGGPVASFAPQKPSHWLTLLYANRQISYEARGVLYGMIRFTLEEVEPAQVQPHRGLLRSFLNSIGPTNSGFISHLCMNFPATERPEAQTEEIRLREDSLQNLQLLQNKCTKLRTIELLIYSRKSVLIDGIDSNIELVQKFLRELDTQLRGISSLTKNILRFHCGPPALSLKELLGEL